MNMQACIQPLPLAGVGAGGGNSAATAKILEVFGRNPISPGDEGGMFSTSHVQRLYEADAISLADFFGDDGNHELVHAIWEHAMEGVVVAAEDGAIVHFNAAAERAFGYRASDVLGLTLPKLFPKPMLDELSNFTGAALDIEKTEGVRRNGTTLPMRVRTTRIAVGNRMLWVIYMRDMTDVDRQRQEIERLAHIDSLTGLPNRNLLADRLRVTLAQARRYRRHFAFMFIDLDHFKSVNDKHGHDLGDRVLREVGKRLRACVRETDTVARIGGDEFAALLTDLKHGDDVRIVAERFLSMAQVPIEVGNLSFNLGASVGISVYPADGDDIETLQRHADAAMYHAKNNGRNQYSFYTSELNSAAERKAMIERGLHRALHAGGLMLHYQPQVDLVTGKLLGAEALMRWNDNGTMMQPFEFIPVAEESGLIVQMGEWALREACRTGQIWRQMGLGEGLGIRIGVNLSVRQFTETLPELVFSILRETGLPPELLDLEITESFLASDHHALDILRRLREGGVHLSVDDFGTGYSCLAYLKGLPLDTIKIDRSFVRDLGPSGSTENLAVVETIVTLANKLNMTTLAEGVECEEQAEALRALGCSVCQGYLYAKPLPEEEFMRYARGGE